MKTLIIGSSSGIGYESVKLLLSQGHQVVATTRHPEPRFLEEFEENSNFSHFTLSLNEPIEISKVLTSQSNLIQDVEALVLNAGIGEISSAERKSLSEHLRMFNINYFSHVEIIRFFLPRFREKHKGVIISLGSLVYTLPFPFKAHYGATKSAFSSYMISLYHEVNKFGIRVHLLEPGWIVSEFHNRLINNEPEDSVYYKDSLPFLDTSKDKSSKSTNSHNVAAKISELIETPTVRLRFLIGKDAKWVYYLSRLLGTRMTHWLLALYLRRSH